MFGEAGNGVLNGGYAGDILNGGTGIDTVSYIGASVGVAVSLDSTLAKTGHARGDIFISIERLKGSNQNDILGGSSGNDVISGAGGSDDLRGYNGNDMLRGGAGADSHNGGLGIDTASYFDASAGVTVSLNSTFTASGFAVGDTFTSIERLQGTNFDDTLGGSDGADILWGMKGKDRLDGGEGSNTFVFAASYDHDHVIGFDQGIDTIELDASLFMGVPTAQDVIDTYGTMYSAGTILTLDFGNGDILDIQSTSALNMATIANDIILGGITG